MNIGGTNGVGGPQRIYPQGVTGQQKPAAVSRTVQGDRVEISDVGRLSDAMSRIPDIRADKVAKAKDMIASGQLDTPENMDTAMNGLLADMGL